MELGERVRITVESLDRRGDFEEYEGTLKDIGATVDGAFFALVHMEE